MAKHASLSELSDWQLVHEEQDIRGWEVRDSSNAVVGRVDDLLVSTDTELVEVIRLEDGKEVAAKEIEIGDGVVYLKGHRAAVEGESEPVVKVYDDARVHRRTEGATDASSYDMYADDFRTHYQTTYGNADNDYDYYEPAYRLGYLYGTDDRYRERDYNALEADLQKRYEADHGVNKWPTVREAARHSFTRARSRGYTKAP